jgi:signal transduction histidine kinase
MNAVRSVGPDPVETTAATVLRRGACAALSIVLLIMYVPRLADLHSDRLASSLADVVFFGIGALCCMRGRIWAGFATTMAALALALVLLGRPETADLTATALGTAAAPLLAPLLAASVASRRWVAAISIGCGVVAGPVHALLVDPFLDPNCTVRCAPSPLAVTHAPGWASLADHGGAWSAAVIISFLVIVEGRKIALLASAVAAVSMLHGTHLTLLVALCGVVAASLIADLVAGLSTSLRLRRLMCALASVPDLQGALRVAVADDNLTVAYEVDAEVEHDAPGHPAAGAVRVTRHGAPSPPPTARQMSTPVRVDGAVLAWIHHSPAASDVARLAATLNGPGRLAFAVERLEAVTVVQSQRIDASRARIVVAGDDERGRMERDIHDGAQQHVLSLGMKIETALLDLGPDDGLRQILEVNLARVRDALGQLRNIAHGLRPFPLEVVGLDAALHALARRSANPLTVHGVPARRLNAGAEHAVLALVQSAVTCSDGPVDIDVSDHGSTVELAITGASMSVVERLSADRVAAIGGSLRSGTNTVTAVIPCAP